jgi:hypothetical protein
MLGGILSTAYAQSKQPSWVLKPPSDSANLYSIGSGENTDLTKAKEESFNEAVSQLVETVNIQFKGEKESQLRSLRSDVLQEYIKKSSRIDDTYLRYDPHTNIYSYVVLVSLHKKFIEPKFIAAFSTKVIDYSSVKVVEKTIIEQRHRKLLGGEFHDSISVYVGDIHESKPFPLIVFQEDTDTAEWSDSTRIDIDDFRTKVNKDRILFEGNIDPHKPEASFSYNNQNYDIYGTVRVKLLTDYLDFEVFRKTK